MAHPNKVKGDGYARHLSRLLWCLVTGFLFVALIYSVAALVFHVESHAAELARVAAALSVAAGIHDCFVRRAERAKERKQ